MPVYLVVGASRGIGLELVRQILAVDTSPLNQVIATVRDPSRASELWTIAGQQGGRCQLLLCDVASEDGIKTFVKELCAIRPLTRIDFAIINAGILHYPNRASATDTFASFKTHLTTNCIGPLTVASQLLASRISIGTMAFMSSDSGSATKFLSYEDGFAAYAASKAALNQGLRHLACELARDGMKTTVLALHPGEVQTDMANVEIEWEVEGMISPEESVRGLLRVLGTKGKEGEASFWTWEGKEHPW